ncbi:sensor histidine kinase [Plectonema radiosum]|uniref:sensor histidine kinase n=1 Tax=Plectonema radiosum TaxID=945768 RepID=UPI002AD1FB5C|nr:CHASE2 domain-containing protein [Plectonema radiosum]
MRRIWSRICKEAELWLRATSPGIIVLVGVILIRIIGGLQPLEWMFLDTMLHLRPKEQIEERVVIVGIDEEDIKYVGQYPIPDGKIAELLTKLLSLKPRAIGLDLFKNVPVNPGSKQLTQVLQENNNIIGIEKILPPGEIPAHKSLPPEQVGFVDLRNDGDIKFRRYLLFTSDPKNKQNDKYSLGLQLVIQYFSAEGTELETGINDEDAILIRGKELPRINNSNFGGYVNVDHGGLSILMNFRNTDKPFRILSLRDIVNGKVNPKWLRNRIVIVGNRNSSAGDVFYTSALPTPKLEGQIYGIDYHAHAVSEIISYVIDNRPMLNSWVDIWEYLWIIIWGFVAIALVRMSESVWLKLFSVCVAGIVLLGCGYTMLWLWGIWIPVAPNLLIFGVGLISFLFYQYDRFLRGQIEERLNTIKYTFNLIHNGPLQTLAYGLRHMRVQDVPLEELIEQFEKLDQEIRAIGDFLQLEALGEKEILRLGSGLILDLNRPLHYLLYEVYSSTLERKDFEYFKTLKVKIRNFDPIDDKKLTKNQKRGICLFLEEALCNIGKHAQGVKRIQASGEYIGNQYKLWVKDNGCGIKSKLENKGTKHCKILAKQLKGEFKRESLFPKGTICELSWIPMKQF